MVGKYVFQAGADWPSGRSGRIPMASPGTEVGRSDDVGRSDKSPAPPPPSTISSRYLLAAPRWAARISHPPR